MPHSLLQFAECLSEAAQNLLRVIDRVQLKGVKEPISLFTLDWDRATALELLNARLHGLPFFSLDLQRANAAASANHPPVIATSLSVADGSLSERPGAPQEGTGDSIQDMMDASSPVKTPLVSSPRTVIVPPLLTQHLSFTGRGDSVIYGNIGPDTEAVNVLADRPVALKKFKRAIRYTASEPTQAADGGGSIGVMNSSMRMAALTSRNCNTDVTVADLRLLQPTLLFGNDFFENADLAIGVRHCELVLVRMAGTHM